ncbi:right-handed parallel beta-helix repeat-containing protein [Methylomonas rhizoryzae]|uniref:right-handed parallel beta-helix repeat-containing protein n=1 Tax=Methylomonas rhizoryzae TaxID=2608981 RepID=UPI001232AFC6|nr:right-handed parallel beta-helix repeat-containing protein [Methylomonas rhizoryzae]
MSMKYALLPAYLLALSLSPSVFAQRVVDCDRGASLAKALAHSHEGKTILFTGTCSGPIVIDTDGIVLQGQGTAVIDGKQQNAVTVRGAQNVKMVDLAVRNGLIGVLVDAHGQVTLSNVTADHNIVSGLDVENTSSATITGLFTSEHNQVFGINVNGGSGLTVSRGQIVAQNNLLGVQLGTAASGFLADPSAKITAANNQSTGLTVVSGSHLVSFGGSIVASGNGRNGVSVNSKAGLDLDAASVLESYDNGANGVQLAESSVMTLFNTTAFSGAPGSTTLRVHDNGGNGVAALHASNFTMVNQVALTGSGNGGAGFFADNGSMATLLNATLSGNATDLMLSFGARSDIRASSANSIVCDATVLSRGDLVCPTP